MRCPFCGYDDPEDVAFCAECGNPLRGSPLLTPSGGQPAIAAPAAASGSQSAGWPDAGQFGTQPQARLIGLEGPVEGVEFVLNKPQMGIGRRPDCDIPVPETGVSRLHAWIRSTPEGYMIEDAGSANGTWVNGVLANKTLPLAEHDVIRIGPCSFVFQVEEQAGYLPPGSMTMVSDVGESPNPFGDSPSPFGDSGYPDPGFADPGLADPGFATGPQPATPPVGPTPGPSPFPPSTWPGPAPLSEHGPAPAEQQAMIVAPSTGDAGSVQSLQQQLGQLSSDLRSWIQRLDGLAASTRALEGQLGPARSESLGNLLREVPDSPPEQYHELQALLDSLKASPTDLKLLLKLSDQVPTLSELIQSHLRLLDALRDLRRG